MDKHYTVAIVGAGTGGISVASRLLRGAPFLKGKVAIIDPAEKHYYQPLWTLVGGGVAEKEVTERSMADLIPQGADWIQEAVNAFYPEENSLTTEANTSITYDYLVVAAGIQVNWDQIKGLRDAIGKDGVCSNYSYEYVDSTWESIRNFKGGKAIFTQPNTPIKCGGAPQKIMYLADEYFRKSGVRDKSEVIFASAAENIFAVKRYADTLDQVIERKQITTNYNRNLVEIIPDKKEAVFENLKTNEKETMKYDMIHVVPPMSAPDFISQSQLADAQGWVDVDPFTLQHKTYANVFSLGDSSNLPTSKTGAAIRKQAPVVAENLLALLKNKEMKATYDGYTSCPLVTGYNSLVLAEFDYDKNPAESFPIDQSKERVSMYIMKKDFLPIMYWNGMLKGVM
ncbi:NAD(P)/FAD-dependent oxidoreductase [Pseudalkalibacillus caeni]|uniref:NAD(P)/FAD-dependent oxidoreductase n=1 Tax=Exobacillus caeni TaxID=2574798 RepID=A0A5R9F9P0_9BACL|nr:FAD/NAD(P)-binding oxidoreductase [Pseudalkalibacillus caeni]TLS37274.1 NAD(P)/FAD-dependent oxidoreductase [Pseudalkalibacillus caeni]